MLRLVMAGWHFVGEAAFALEGGTFSDECWNSWVEGEFTDRIAPCMVGVFTEARHGRAREVAEADLSLVLARDEASRNAGDALLEVLASARSVPPVSKLATMAADGLSLHLASAVAVQGAVFNLPVVSAMLGYLFCEWKLARRTAGLAQCEHTAELFSATNASLQQRLRHLPALTFGSPLADAS